MCITTGFVHPILFEKALGRVMLCLKGCALVALGALMVLGFRLVLHFGEGLGEHGTTTSAFINLPKPSEEQRSLGVASICCFPDPFHHHALRVG